MLLARMRRAAHRAGEHEVLGQPHRLVAELLGRERRVVVEVRVERAERDAELHDSRSRERFARGDPAAVGGAAPAAGGEVAAVDVDRRAGDEARPVGREVDRGAPRRRRRARRSAAASSPAGRRRCPGVGITSGAMQLTRMRRSPSSSASDLREVHERGLHRAVDREAGRGAVRLDRRDVDDRRRPSAGICGTHARTKFVTLVKFSRISASWPLSLTSRNAAAEPAARVVDEHVDAVERRDPRRAPRRRRGRRAARRARAGPRPRPRPAVRARPSASRSQIATSAPKRANVTAIAAPMPWAAPVTTHEAVGEQRRRRA